MQLHTGQLRNVCYLINTLFSHLGTWGCTQQLQSNAAFRSYAKLSNCLPMPQKWLHAPNIWLLLPTGYAEHAVGVMQCGAAAWRSIRIDWSLGPSYHQKNDKTVLKSFPDSRIHREMREIQRGEVGGRCGSVKTNLKKKKKRTNQAEFSLCPPRVTYICSP